eukprot:10477909-Ditylum_brightwellii.AAC.1
MPHGGTKFCTTKRCPMVVKFLYHQVASLDGTKFWYHQEMLLGETKFCTTKRHPIVEEYGVPPKDRPL